MTIQEQLRAALRQAQDIADQHTTPRDRLVQLRTLLEQVFLTLTRYADANLTDQFARIEYCRRKGHVPKTLIDNAHQFRKIGNDVVHATAYAGTDDDVQAGIDLLVGLARYARIETPDIVAVRHEPHAVPDAASLPPVPDVINVVPTRVVTLAHGSRIALRALVLSTTVSVEAAGPSALVELALDLGEQPVMRTLQLQGPWLDTPLWPFVTVWLHDVQVVDDEYLLADANSLVVVQPDIVLNSREIASCYKTGASNIAARFGEMLQERKIETNLTAGNLGAQAFASMLSDSTQSQSEILDGATESCLEEYSMLPQASRNEARKRIADQLPRLQSIADFAAGNPHEVESFYIADRLGMQGKPDALVRTSGASYLFELKTGKPPEYDRQITLRAGGTIRVPERYEHVIQAACYAMMQQELFPAETFRAFLLYPSSDDKTKARREIRVPQELRVDIIATRNALVTAEHRIIHGEPPFPSSLAQPLLQTRFDKDKGVLAGDFARVFEAVAGGTASREEQWFARQVQHIYREVWANRLGTIDGVRTVAGFSSLWSNTDLAGKVRSGEALWHMVHQPELTDGPRIAFALDLDDLGSSEFREGDMVLLFPHVDDHASPTRHRLLRGRLEGRDPDRPELIRIKLSEAESQGYLAAHGEWALAGDIADASAARQVKALWLLLRSAPHKIGLVDGTGAPGTPALDQSLLPASLVDALVERAAAAPDYFLVQGPPGTGKTRRFLPSLVKAYLERDQRPIIAVAFTNRAVDEMRRAIEAQKIRLDPFLGFGDIGDGLSVNERATKFREALDRTQVFVMTVHQALRRIEWLQSLRPQAVIVDEASQLIDALIAGLFAIDAPFVMIGDHRQLPPIVVHPRRTQAEDDRQDEVVDEDLSSGQDEPVLSTFEIMLAACQRNGWEHATGMLIEQHRMHQEIQTFPSMSAYDSRLICATNWQRDATSRWVSHAGLPRIVTTHRVCFVDVGADTGDAPRLNRREAELAAELAVRFVRAAKALGVTDHNGHGPVGIVAPFRVQCAAIRHELHRRGVGADVLVDTVERFQGSERAVMIVSLTAKDDRELGRSLSLSPDGQVDRKLNVAITRAREHLVVLGDRTVAEKNHIFAAYLSYLEGCEQIIPASFVLRELEEEAVGS